MFSTMGPQCVQWLKIGHILNVCFYHDQNVPTNYELAAFWMISINVITMCPVVKNWAHLKYNNFLQGACFPCHTSPFHQLLSITPTSLASMRPDCPLIQFFDVPAKEVRYFINQYSVLAYLIWNLELHWNFFPCIRLNTSVVYHYYGGASHLMTTTLWQVGTSRN